MVQPDRGRVAVVTGAARGIGAAIAGRLLADGYSVLAVDRDDDALSATADGLAEHGNVSVMVEELTAPEGPAAVVAAARDRYGRVDVLVNNAGVVPMGPFLDASTEDIGLALDVNVRALYLLTQSVARSSVGHGTEHGRISSLGTVNTVVGTLHSSAYAASKGAVSALTRQLAVELGPYGITCNEVAPGPVATDRVLATLTADQIEARRARIPTGVQPEPDDVAGAVAYLASDRSGAVNGQTLFVDGGFAIKGA